MITPAPERRRPPRGRRGVELLLVAVAALAISGCASFPGRRLAAYRPGTILVMPPRDAVQNGEPHPAAEGSGRVLMEQLSRYMSRSSYSLIETRSAAFTSIGVASKEAALQEARALKADYCLQLVLGEFLDAAPMTFRSDSVVLNQATLYETATGREVWRSLRPVLYQGSNLGSFTTLMRPTAKQLARSITGGR